MKRSEINALIMEAQNFIKGFHFALPPFADWTPAEWNEKGHAYDEIRDNGLGWDVTDYGFDKFDEIGLVLFTLRNGNFQSANYIKPYAEKLLISRENQVCPMHFHYTKMEDIINRGGGILMVELYCSTENGLLDKTAPVSLSINGEWRTVPPGTIIELSPGQSVSLTPAMYHAFWAKEGAGSVLIGEVSQVNDDHSDNRFFEPMHRFPAIEEDTLPYRLLCTEYPPAK